MMICVYALLVLYKPDYYLRTKLMLWPRSIILLLIILLLRAFLTGSSHCWTIFSTKFIHAIWKTSHLWFGLTEALTSEYCQYNRLAIAFSKQAHILLQLQKKKKYFSVPGQFYIQHSQFSPVSLQIVLSCCVNRQDSLHLWNWVPVLWRKKQRSLTVVVTKVIFLFPYPIMLSPQNLVKLELFR